MTIDETVVHEIVGEIWGSMLELDTAPIEACEPRDLGREVRAAVQITGSWEGAVVLECEDAVAAAFTAAMLGLGEEKPDESDVKDVVGELANMVGGNLKAALGAEARLSLPTVVVGANLEVSVPGSVVQAQTAYATGVGCFSVVVVAKA